MRLLPGPSQRHEIWLRTSRQHVATFPVVGICGLRRRSCWKSFIAVPRLLLSPFPSLSIHLLTPIHITAIRPSSTHLCIPFPHSPHITPPPQHPSQTSASPFRTSSHPLSPPPPALPPRGQPNANRPNCQELTKIGEGEVGSGMGWKERRVLSFTWKFYLSQVGFDDEKCHWVYECSFGAVLLCRSCPSLVRVVSFLRHENAPPVGWLFPPCGPGAFSK